MPGQFCRFRPVGAGSTRWSQCLPSLGSTEGWGWGAVGLPRVFLSVFPELFPVLGMWWKQWMKRVHPRPHIADLRVTSFWTTNQINKLLSPSSKCHQDKPGWCNSDGDGEEAGDWASLGGMIEKITMRVGIWKRGRNQLCKDLRQDFSWQKEQLLQRPWGRNRLLGPKVLGLGCSDERRGTNRAGHGEDCFVCLGQWELIAGERLVLISVLKVPSGYFMECHL